MSEDVGGVQGFAVRYMVIRNEKPQRKNENKRDEKKEKEEHE